jgi:hypothetical protein
MRRRISGQEFSAQAAQTGLIINIISRRQQFDFEAQFARTLFGLSKHAVGAPINPLKDFLMRLLNPNQVIAAIIART